MDKKVLHVKIPKKMSYNSEKSYLEMSKSLKKAFSDRYDIIFTTDDIYIHSDDIVILNIDNSTDINMLAKKLNELSIEKGE